MEAKTTRCHSIQAAEAVCSKAISDTEAWKTSQAMMFQEEHSKYLQSLEQAFGEESRSCHEVLSSCQAALCHSPQPLRGALAASYHLLLGKAPPSPSLILPLRTPSTKETAIYSRSPYANTQTVSKTEKAASFARANGEHAPGVEPPQWLH